MLVGRGVAWAEAEDGGRWRDGSFRIGVSLADGDYLAGMTSPPAAKHHIVRWLNADVVGDSLSSILPHRGTKLEVRPKSGAAAKIVSRRERQESEAKSYRLIRRAFRDAAIADGWRFAAGVHFSVGPLGPGL